MFPSTDVRFNADSVELRTVRNERIIMSYMVLPDKIYDRAIREVNRVVKDTAKEWNQEKLSFRGNRMIIVGLPQVEEEEDSVSESES